MNKNKLARAYKKMASSIEKLRIYDGRGTFDIYVCEKCNHKQVTTYGDKGVTPFTMRCPNCGGMMVHTSTVESIEKSTPFKKWVRPTLDQFLKLSPGCQDHVLNGGLLLEDEI